MEILEQPTVQVAGVVVLLVGFIVALFLGGGWACRAWERRHDRRHVQAARTIRERILAARAAPRPAQAGPQTPGGYGEAPTPAVPTGQPPVRAAAP